MCILALSVFAGDFGMLLHLFVIAMLASRCVPRTVQICSSNMCKNTINVFTFKSNFPNGMNYVSIYTLRLLN